MSQGRSHKTSNARRRAILQAALDCFLANGYDATTMAEVSAASGASIGSLYHHYGAKESLAAALYADALGSYFQSWFVILERSRGPEQAVKAVVHNHFTWLEDHQSEGTVLFGHPVPGAVARRHSAVAELTKRFNEELLAWIKPRIGPDGFARLPDDVYQPLWIGPAQELTRSFVGYERSGDLKAAAPQLARAAWAGLRHPMSSQNA